MRMSVFSTKRVIFAAAIAVAAFGGTYGPSQAAELGPGYGPGVRHARTTGHYWNWRDRCAWAGNYCLYAWDGYVYHYPWDDRSYAYGYRRYRYRYRG
jgi:hypothetical protein